MDYLEEHRLLSAKLFTEASKHEVLRLLTEYYSGERWNDANQLVMLGSTINIRINFPISKVKRLDHRRNPIVWPRELLVQTLGRPMFEIDMKKSVKSIDYKVFPVFMHALQTTEAPPFISKHGGIFDYDNECVLSYFTEGDAVIAQAILDECFT